VAALVWLMPLRLLLPEGLAATSVSGSIWKGRIMAAQWRGLGLGDLDLGLSLRRGSLVVTGPQLGGAVRPGGVEGLSGRVDVPGVGAVQLEAVSVHFEGDSCREASGRLLATLAGEALAGPLGCDGAVARAVMVRPDGVAVATLRLGAGGAVEVLGP
jgi:hypothetical protein